MSVYLPPSYTKAVTVDTDPRCSGLFYKVEMKAVLSLLKFKLGRCDLSCVGGGSRLHFHGVASIRRLVEAPETLCQNLLALFPEPVTDGHVDYEVGCRVDDDE